jgi:nicotinate-nucleotide pyrophosphorylase (carboxylating)
VLIPLPSCKEQVVNIQSDMIKFIGQAFHEDVGSGDHTSMACIEAHATGKAKLLIKEEGIVAGVDLARMIFASFDESLQFEPLISEGTKVSPGDIVFHISGPARSILTSERLALNCMQRMSGIATLTRRYADALHGLTTKVLDTRKTTPLCRTIEKWAVKTGGGENHRYGLFDMILIKDNHIDYAGGIEKAILAAEKYLAQKKLTLPVEIETRNLEEVQQVLDTGKVNRIMLDNFTPALLKKAVELIDRRFETEASGGITLETIRSYAESGVDFISCGALTHSARSLDMSLKATFN